MLRSGFGRGIPSIASKRPAIVPGRTQGFVAGDCGRAVLPTRSAALPDGDDCGSLAVYDGCVAAAGVIGAVGSHSANLFVFGDLVEQVWQDRTVAVADGGELHRPDVAASMARWTLRH